MIMLFVPEIRLVVALSLMALASALALVISTHHCRTQYSTLQRLELQHWALQEDYSRLLLEHSTWAAPHRIDALARDALNMAPPELNRIFVVAQ